MAKFKVAVIIGSNRRESVNRRLGHALTKLGADKFAFSFIQIDDLPLYNQDLEAELPNTVARFKVRDCGGRRLAVRDAGA
jgi:chromate reductase